MAKFMASSPNLEVDCYITVHYMFQHFITEHDFFSFHKMVQVKF